MIWAACMVCDSVMLQELLELLAIVAWTIVTPDYMRLTQLCDNRRQFYAHDCRGGIGQFPHQNVLGEDICNYQKVHPFPVESVANVCHGNGGSSCVVPMTS